MTIEPPFGRKHDPETFYLELLKRALINTLYLEDEERIFYLRRCIEGKEQFSYHALHNVVREFPDVHAEFIRSRRVGQFPYRKIHNSGFGHSMIGTLRMDHLHECMEVVRQEDLSGDLMECGVWRGGACIFMQGYLRVYGLKDRRIIVADSFAGLPRPRGRDVLDLSRETFPELAVCREDVEQNFRRYDLWDTNVVLVEGWFDHTLPTAPVDRIALLRLDADIYSSTMDSLKHLYDHVVPGGFVIVDDFANLSECQAAVTDFFQLRGQPVPAYKEVDWTAVSWRRE